MASGAVLQPREAWKLRNAVAAQVATHAFTALPIGFWQRRVGARAFALDLVPAMPRESRRVRMWRLSGVPSIWMVATDVMTWGLIPWQWRGDARTEVTEARRALRRVLAAASVPSCAAVFVTSPPHAAAAREHLPRLRLTGATSVSAVVGAITIGELVDVFDDGARELTDDDGRQLAADVCHQLRVLAATPE